MTEPTTFLIPGQGCKDCAWVANIKERQVDNTARMVVVEGVLPLKLNWASFRWIIGGLCAGAIIAIAANFTMLSMVSTNQHRMEINQMSMSKDIDSLKIELLKHSKGEK